MSIAEVKASMEATKGELEQKLAVLETEREAINRQIKQVRRDERALDRIAKRLDVDLSPAPVAPELNEDED